MFVFYDTETTGTNIVFDQIIQFGAVLTDDRLREVDRLEMRCQLLPWVIPSPMALLVTDTEPDRLTDPGLPTFLEMMEAICERLRTWSPATFIGYNSMRFDEPLLQRAFWQTLHPPYVTITNGNSRLDLLPVIRATAHLLPGVLALPKRAEGGPSFKLDQVAPLNGFDSHRAHDAMGDVEATIFLARLLADRVPDLWQLLIQRASKSRTAETLSFGRPVLVFEHVTGKSAVWFGQRIDRKGVRTSHATVVMLGFDWRSSRDASQGSFEDPHAMREFVRRIALNRAPIIFTIEEAATKFSMACGAEEIAQSAFLEADEEYCAQLVHNLGAAPDYPAGTGELEELIFDGFPAKSDETLMAAFQVADWPQRVEIARAFNDRRLHRLALRLVYVSAPHLLLQEERERIRTGIAKRLDASTVSAQPWRSIKDALQELELDGHELELDERVSKIESWLKERFNKLSFDLGAMP